MYGIKLLIKTITLNTNEESGGAPFLVQGRAADDKTLVKPKRGSLYPRDAISFSILAHNLRRPARPISFSLHHHQLFFYYKEISKGKKGKFHLLTLQHSKQNNHLPKPPTHHCFESQEQSKRQKPHLLFFRSSPHQENILFNVPHQLAYSPLLYWFLKVSAYLRYSDLFSLLPFFFLMLFVLYSVHANLYTAHC